MRRLPGDRDVYEDSQILCRRYLGESGGVGSNVSGRYREYHWQRPKVERELVVTDLKGNCFDSNVGAFER